MDTSRSSSDPSCPAGATHRLLEDLLWLRVLANRLLGDPELAEDACQEAWMVARERGGESGESGDRRPVLFRAMRRFAWRSRRSERRRQQREAVGAQPEALPSTEDLLMRGEQRRRLWERLASLDEPFRTTLLLRFQEGLDTEEIALRAQVARDTVRWRLRRGLELLRERYRAEGEGDESSGFASLAIAALPLGLPSTTSAVAASAAVAGWTSASSGSAALAPAGQGVAKVGALWSAVLGVWVMKKSVLLCGVAIVAGVLGVSLWDGDPGGDAMVAGTGDAERVAADAALERESASVEEASPALASAESAPVREDVAASVPAASVEPEGCRVIGMVVDEAGEPLAGAKVSLLGGSLHWSATPEWTRDAVAGADGRFELISNGFQGKLPIQLIASASPFRRRVALRFGGGEDDHFGALVVPEIDVGKVKLRPGSALRGRLLNAAGVPIEGAWIDVRQFRGHARSNALGRFELVHLHPGRRSISLKRAGFVSQEMERVLSGEPGQWLDLGDVTMADAPRVRGRLISASGKPLTEMTVSTKGYTRGFVFDVGPDGRFDVPLPGDAPCKIYAHAKDHEQTDGERVVPGQDGVEITLQPYAPRGRFVVVDAETGERIVRFGIRIREGEGSETPVDDRPVTGGKPRVRDFSKGSCTVPCRVGFDQVDVIAPGYLRKQVDVVAATFEDGGQQLALTRAPSVHGQIVDGAGRPVAGVDLVMLFGDVGRVENLGDPGDLEPFDKETPVAKLLRAQGGYAMPSVLALDTPMPAVVHCGFLGRMARRKVQTDEDGRFRFVGMDLGGARLVLGVSERRTEVLPLDLFVVGRDRDVDLGRVALVEPARLQGRLQPTWPCELRGTKISLRSLPGRSAEVAADGTFDFGAVPPGNHRVTVQPGKEMCAPGVESKQFFFRLAAGEERELTLPVEASPGCNLRVTLTINGASGRGASVDFRRTGTTDEVASLKIGADGRGAGLVPAGVPLDVRLWLHDAAVPGPVAWVLPAGDFEHAFEVAVGALEVAVPLSYALPKEGRMLLRCSTRDGVSLGEPLTIDVQYDEGVVRGAQESGDLRFVFGRVQPTATQFELLYQNGGPYARTPPALIGRFEASVTPGEETAVVLR